MKQPKAPATLTTLLVGKYEGFKDWAELPPLITLLTHAIALGEGRQGGETLKMQNLIRRLFGDRKWLEKVFGWLTPDEQARVDACSAKIPVVQAANYSLGVNLLLALVRQAAAVLGPQYDVEVVEMHHRHKKDAPSGTALMLAHAAAEGRGVKLDDVACYGRKGLVGERPAGEIALHALRGGSVVGDHTVMFAGDVERVEITHRAQSREAFAAGALRAALWAVGRKPGKYDMRDVLGFAR